MSDNDTLGNLAANAAVPLNTSIISTTPIAGAKLTELKGKKE